MLPLMSEYLFSDLTRSSKNRRCAYFFVTSMNALLLIMVGIILTKTVWLSFGGETYNGIKYANTIISYIDKVEGLDESIKNEYLGRAYFSSCLSLFKFVSFQFGDVPFVSKIIDRPKQDYKSTKNERLS